MDINEAIETVLRQESIAVMQYEGLRESGRKKKEDFVGASSERIWLRGFLEACGRFKKILMDLRSFDGSTSVSVIDFLVQTLKEAEQNGRQMHLQYLRDPSASNARTLRDCEVQKAAYKTVYKFVTGEKEERGGDE